MKEIISLNLSATLKVGTREEPFHLPYIVVIQHYPCIVSLTDDVRDRRWKSTATTTPILNLAVYQQYHSH